MFNSNGNKQKLYKIFVVRSLSSENALNSTLGLEGVIVETYGAGAKRDISVPINEAERALSRLGDGHYIATDNPEIAEKYSIRVYDMNARLTEKIK